MSNNRKLEKQSRIEDFHQSSKKSKIWLLDTETMESLPTAVKDSITSNSTIEDEDKSDLLEDTLIEFEEKSLEQDILWKPFELDKLIAPFKTKSSLKASNDHVIFVQVTNTSLPYPHSVRDIWDSNYVRLPCSPKNVYPDDSGKLIQRWNNIVETLNCEINSVNVVSSVILSYNKRFTNFWNFNILKDIYRFDSEQYNKTIKAMISTARLLPELITHPIPMMKKNQNLSFTFNQYQIACLLTHAFFCTYPRRNKTGPKSEYGSYPSINFSSLLSTNVAEKKREKLRCLMAYFDQTCSKISSGNKDDFGLVTFTRKVLTKPPVWSTSTVKISNIQLCVSSTGAIENAGYNTIQVDFANKYLGGGVLGSGCVQEEILLCIKPEILIGRLFVEKLADNEALIISGAQRYANYIGYSDTFRFAEPNIEQCIGNRDEWNRLRSYVAAIDALVYDDLVTQVSARYFSRDLNKAFCAYSDSVGSAWNIMPKVVATGHWGCGAFGGNKEVKACAESSKDLAYFTFGDESFRDRFLKLYTLLCLKDVTVGKLYSMVNNFSEIIFQMKSEDAESQSLFEFIFTQLDVHSSD